jgi:hypothetical protein
MKGLTMTAGDERREGIIHSRNAVDVNLFFFYQRGKVVLIVLEAFPVPTRPLFGVWCFISCRHHHSRQQSQLAWCRQRSARKGVLEWCDEEVSARPTKTRREATANKLYSQTVIGGLGWARWWWCKMWEGSEAPKEVYT